MESQKSEHSLLRSVIRSLTDLIEKGNAHAPLDKALKDMPLSLLGERPGNLPYSIWQIAEHIRIAQWDLLEFSRNENHISPPWPDGYWPKETAPVSEDAWNKCIKQVHEDRKSFIKLIEDAGDNIDKPFAYGTGQSLLKEALVLADHNGYHTGEIVVIRRLLNNWT